MSASKQDDLQREASFKKGGSWIEKSRKEERSSGETLHENGTAYSTADEKK